MAEISFAVQGATKPLQQAMAELSPEEKQTLLAMIEAGDDSWLHIGDVTQPGPIIDALVFTVGLNREAIAAFKPE